MKNCMIILRDKKQGPAQSLKKVFENHGYQVYWDKEIDEVWPQPEYILFSGNEQELNRLIKSTENIPIFLLSSISPGLFSRLLHQPVYPLVFLNQQGKLDGMVIGLDRDKNLKPFRCLLRDLAVPFMVMNRIEAFILHYLYEHWDEVKERLFEVLNQFCLSFRCDGVTILRGLGLDGGIGQMKDLPTFTEEPWNHVLKEIMEEIGGEHDLLLLLKKDKQSSQMKVKTWKKYKHLFRQPHIIDCINLFEPEELMAVGYPYVSLFRYRFLLNREY